MSHGESCIYSVRCFHRYIPALDNESLAHGYSDWPLRCCSLNTLICFITCHSDIRARCCFLQRWCCCDLWKSVFSFFFVAFLYFLFSSCPHGLMVRWWFVIFFLCVNLYERWFERGKKKPTSLTANWWVQKFVPQWVFKDKIASYGPINLKPKSDISENGHFENNVWKWKCLWPQWIYSATRRQS